MNMPDGRGVKFVHMNIYKIRIFNIYMFLSHQSLYSVKLKMLLKKKCVPSLSSIIITLYFLNIGVKAVTQNECRKKIKSKMCSGCCSEEVGYDEF